MEDLTIKIAQYGGRHDIQPNSGRKPGDIWSTLKVIWSGFMLTSCGWEVVDPDHRVAGHVHAVAGQKTGMYRRSLICGLSRENALGGETGREQKSYDGSKTLSPAVFMLVGAWFTGPSDNTCRLAPYSQLAGKLRPTDRCQPRLGNLYRDLAQPLGLQAQLTQAHHASNLRYGPALGLGEPAAAPGIHQFERRHWRDHVPFMPPETRAAGRLIAPGELAPAVPAVWLAVIAA